ncbi:MAG: zinc ribbon domain-containing protein [Chloroflexi bacterium]|nr:zinc ribbon domain-containing protein [Chloroflexota bacterium]
MADDLFKSIGDSFNALLSNQVVQVALQLIVAYIILVWLLTAFWAFRDMQHRTNNPVAPYLAAGLIVAFTPILFLFAVILYRIVRPRETIAESNERALAEEAILAEIEARPHCANCSRAVEEEWIICPTCRNRLRRVCPNCSRLVELDWTLCAWCGKDFERPEVVAPAYMPGPRAQLEGPPMPMQVEGPPRPVLAPGMLGPEMTPVRER